MPRDTLPLPLQDYLALRLQTFLQSVRALGLPVDEEEAMNNYPLWEQDYLRLQQHQVAA